MKRVVLNPVEEFVVIHNLKDDDLIGVKFKNGVRGFVVKTEPKSYCICSIERNTYHSKVFGISILDLIKNKLEGIENTFTFDKESDLMNWLNDTSDETV